MADVVSSDVRSRMMAGIRATHTKPELTIRKGLHGKGFRFRLHGKNLLGKPDIVFPKYEALIFTHGCFWHGHDHCHLFKWPKSRKAFWRAKLSANKKRDIHVLEKLEAAGWRIGIVWECALKGPHRLPTEELIERCSKWLRSRRRRLVLTGKTRNIAKAAKAKRHKS